MSSIAINPVRPWPGLYVAFQDSSRNNTITIHNSTFESNICYKFGGGGADVGYLFSQKDPPQNNSLSFQNCNFTNNTAKYGGGAELYLSRGFYSTWNVFLNIVTGRKTKW